MLQNLLVKEKLYFNQSISSIISSLLFIGSWWENYTQLVKELYSVDVKLYPNCNCSVHQMDIKARKKRQRK